MTGVQTCALPIYAVHRFTSTGTPLGFFVTAGSGGLSYPRGLAFGPNGNLFVASGLTGEILQYNGTTGAFVNVFVDSGGNGGGPMDPYGITFRNGDLYVASFFPNQVKRFNGTTGAFVSTFVTSGSGGLDGPIDFGFQPTAPAPPTVPALSGGGLCVLVVGLVLAGSLRARRGAFSGTPSA